MHALVRTLWLLSWTLLVTKSSLGLPEALAQVDDYETYDTDDSNNTTPSESTTPTPTPILTPEAIANITATGAVIIFLGIAITILMCTFEKYEHKLRIKTALERNKQIDRQIAAEKRFKELRAEEFRKKQAEEAAKNVLPVRGTLTEDGRVHYEEAKQEDIVMPPEGNSLKEETINETDKPFVNVSLDSYSPLPSENEPPVLIVHVQPGNT